MSDRYPGGFIKAVPPVTPSEYSAPGIWTLEQAAVYKKAGQWPLTSDPYFNQTTLLLHGDGTNGAQNNTFLDSSTNNFTITRNGNTTQGTFSPFSVADGEWSNYFDGTANGSLQANSSTDTDLSGDFTIQAWVYPTANGQSSNSEIISRGAASTLNGWHFGLVASTTQPFFGINYAGTGATVYTASSTNIPLNQWTHLAVTRSSNTVIIYINGVADTTNTGFTGTPTVSGTEYVYVGRASYDTSNRQFTGYISNASIVKGTAATTFNTTSPLATGTSGQSLLTCYLNRFVDANTATTAKALTVGSGASVQPFSPFAPSAAYSPSVNGGSGYFDGNGDSLTIPASADFAFGTGDFTIEFWGYFSSIDASDTIYIHGNTNATVQLFFVNGKLRYNNNGVASVLDTTTTIPTNQWMHFAIVRSSGTAKWYLNGVEDASTSDTTNWSSSATDLTIGRDPLQSGRDITGYLANLRVVKGTAVYTAAFTPPTAPLTAVTNTKLLLNFTNAGIFDNTGKNNLETVGNAQIDTTTKKYGTGSMEFDGNDALVVSGSTVDLALSTGSYTVEFWVYFNGDPNNGGLNGQASLVRTGNADGFVIQRYNGEWEVGKEPTPELQIVQSLNSGQWYHVALVRQALATPVLELFIDGVSIGSRTNADVGDSFNGDFYFGNLYKTGGSTRALTGFIDDLRITKGVARYTANFTPPGGPFLNK